VSKVEKCVFQVYTWIIEPKSSRGSHRRGSGLLHGSLVGNRIVSLLVKFAQ